MITIAVSTTSTNWVMASKANATHCRVGGTGDVIVISPGITELPGGVNPYFRLLGTTIRNFGADFYFAVAQPGKAIQETPGATRLS
jgi:hypothetical protein